MTIFQVFRMIGGVAAKTEKVTEEVAKLEGVDFKTLSKLEAIAKLNPLLNAAIDLAEVATNDEGDKTLEEIRLVLNEISKPE